MSEHLVCPVLEPPPAQIAPFFPNFKPLEMSDRAAIEPFTQRFEPYSDFCFSTLIFYNINNHTHWCWLNGNLVLRFCDPFGPGTYLTFLGAEQPAATADAIIDYAAEMNYSTTLWRVPEITAQAIECENSHLEIKAERNTFDYVYLTNRLSRLETHAFAAHRRKIRQFQRKHFKYKLVHLDLRCCTELMSVRSTLAQWCPLKHGTDTLKYYCSAFETCLCHTGRFRLEAMGLFVDDSMVAFNLSERIRGDWLLSHFQAFDPIDRAASTFLLHEMVHHASGLGLQHFNFQEDMGHPGLRRYKTDWSPCGFLRKYSVSKAKDCAAC